MRCFFIARKTDIFKTVHLQCVYLQTLKGWLGKCLRFAYKNRSSVCMRKCVCVCMCTCVYAHIFTHTFVFVV